MQNTTNTTAPAGYSRAALVEALRQVSESRHKYLVLHPLGWFAVPEPLIDAAEEIALLDYEVLSAATPDESPEDYTDETIEGLAEWVEGNIRERVWVAIDLAREKVQREEADSAQVEQRPANPNATSERLETLRKILANLKSA